MKTYEEMADSVFKRINDYHLKKKKKRKMWIRSGIGVAILLFVSLIVLNIRRPILARELPIVGEVFEHIQDKLTYAGFYSNYAYQIGETACDKDISITLSEVYCDGTYLYASFIVDGIDFSKDLENKNYSQFQLDYNGDTHIVKNNKKMELSGAGFWSGLEGEFIDDDTFVGMDILHLNDNADFPEDFKLDINMKYIGILGDKQKGVLGNWSFSVDVKAEKDDVLTYEINATKGDYSIDRIMVSPVVVTLFVSYPYDANNLRQYSVKCYSDFSESDSIYYSGIYKMNEAIIRVPRKYVSKYLDIYFYELDQESDYQKYWNRDDIEQHAIVSAHLDLNE